jgi:adenylate kinase
VIILKLVIAVTGTPASGKTTFAKALAKELKAQLIEINDVVKEKHLFSHKDRFGTMVVMLPELSTALKDMLQNASGTVVVVGHLAPELNVKYNAAVVVREKLKVIAERERKRGYPLEKIRDNLIAEATDYCGSLMRGKVTDTYEVETESDKKAITEYFKSLTHGRSTMRPKTIEIDKLKEIIDMVKNGNKYKL